MKVAKIITKIIYELPPLYVKKNNCMKKTIKAWAIFNKETGLIEWAAYFSESDCPASNPPNGIAVYESRKMAREDIISDTYRIVPITISYEMPIAKKEKGG